MMLDNAREHGVDAHEGVRVHDVLFEGDRAVGVTHQGRGRRVPRGARAGGRRRQRPERPADEPAAAARVGSDAEQGRHLDLLGRRLSRHRPRRGRDARDPDRQQERLVLVHPAAQRHRQRRRRRAVRLSVQGARPATRRPTTKRSTRCPGVKERVANAKRVTGYFATKDYSYRSKQVAGDGWVLVGDAFGFLDPLYSSGVLLALRVGRAGRRRDRRGPRERATRRRRNWASGARRSTKASTACGGWSASTTTASASATWCGSYPGAARHADRSADRRPVRRSRRQGLAAARVALQPGKTPISRRGTPACPRTSRAGQGQRAGAARRTQAVDSA